MNTLNKKLGAMGLNTFDYYKDAFLEFNSNNIDKPRVTTFTPPVVYTNIDFFNNFPETYHSYKRNGVWVAEEFELVVGEILHVGSTNYGIDNVVKVEILDKGFRILEETTTQGSGLCLYEGVRKEFFDKVGLPDIGLSHQLFDEFVSNYYSY